MKISNASLVERLKLALFEPKARIEIISEDDLFASRKLRKFAFYIANTLSNKYPNLKVIDVFRTDDPFNFCKNPILWGMYQGYAICIPRNSNLKEIKRACIELEINKEGKRICDIDVYETRDKKISRTDLGYSKDLS